MTIILIRYSIPHKKFFGKTSLNVCFSSFYSKKPTYDQFSKIFNNNYLI